MEAYQLPYVSNLSPRKSKFALSIIYYLLIHGVGMCCNGFSKAIFHSFLMFFFTSFACRNLHMVSRMVVMSMFGYADGLTEKWSMWERKGGIGQPQHAGP